LGSIVVFDRVGQELQVVAQAQIDRQVVARLPLILPLDQAYF
jgi:hypothetical protein